MKVKVRNPKIQVLLHKVVTRTSPEGSAPQAQSTTGSGAPQGFTSQQYSQVDSPSNVIDVTNWLGEGSIVRVQKSVRDGAGAFQIEFVDQLMSPLNDTLYALIEPSDMFEIRFAGEAFKYAGAAGQQLPIMMRGFVSKITRSQGMGSDGKPRRTIQVVGHDYGKILQLIQIFNMPNTPEVSNVISSFPLFAKYGPDLNVQNSTDFVNQVFDLIVNPYIQGLQAAGATAGAALDSVTTDIQVPPALVSVQLGAFNGGTLEALLAEYLDTNPFNEFFIEDRDAGPWGAAGPYAVYRPAPFMDAISRDMIQDIQTSPTTGVSNTSALAPNANCVAIQSDSIISINANRSDEKVANYFWVDSPRFSMNYDDLTLRYAAYAAQHGEAPFYLADYGNVNPSLYGLRKLEVTTQQGSVEETNSGNGQPAGEQMFDNMKSFLDWIDDRRNTLIAMNQDNVVLEDGDMHLRGDEKIKAGCYVQVNYGNQLQSTHYAHTVSHVFEPFGSYFVEVEYDRGTNFVDRCVQGGAGIDLYHSEMLSPGGAQ
ncbi:hypothetical protein PQR46_18600 [Paraburkholderia sediminicola]|uniref:hypothetical protein n=1 Tax=Paraburkholderia sediminicola TaxID=458836 RepID=UPI0038BB5494